MNTDDKAQQPSNPMSAAMLDLSKKQSDNDSENNMLDELFAKHSASQTTEEDLPVDAPLSETLSEFGAKSEQSNTPATPEVSVLQPNARSTPINEFAKATLFSTSKVPLAVYSVIALLMLIAAQFPMVWANMLFSPEELTQLPAFILDNLGTIFGGFFILLLLGSLYMGIKESFTGKLNVYEDYLAFKGKLFKTDKIHYADVRSIIVHRSPYTLFGDIGHLEVMGRSKEFTFKNVSKPFELKEVLLHRKELFLKSQ
jgi:hypothetical protein